MKIVSFADPGSLGRHLARQILEQVAQAQRESRRFLLGCPTGRSPLSTYRAMAAMLGARPQSLAPLVLVMMDEYLVETPGGLAMPPPAAHFSCRGFAGREMMEPFNAALPPTLQLPADQVWFPDPADPRAIERRVADAGGIDLFILASGAGDGHVAFNPPGSNRQGRTRVTELSEQTRRDNMATFPAFRALDEVPRFGISLGLGTIAEARAAAMILSGADKQEAFRRVSRAAGFDPAWPATILADMPDAVLLADAAAQG